MSHVWVRLQPHNPKRGFTQMRYHYSDQLYVGGVKPNWYKVKAGRAAILEELSQDDQDPNSPPLFELADEAMKNEIDQKELQRRMVQLNLLAHNAPIPTTALPTSVDLTTDALKGGGREAAIPPTEPDPAPVVTKKVSERKSLLARALGGGKNKSKTPAKKTSRRSSKKK